MLASFSPEREFLLASCPNVEGLVQSVGERDSVRRLLPHHGF